MLRIPYHYFMARFEHGWNGWMEWLVARHVIVLLLGVLCTGKEWLVAKDVVVLVKSIDSLGELRIACNCITKV